MQTLDRYITAGEKRTDERMQMSSVDLTFQYVRKLDDGTVIYTGEPVKFSVHKPMGKDALALVHDKGVIAVYHEDGKVELHNPALLFTDMVYPLSQNFVDIFKGTRRERKEYANMARPDDISDITLVSDFAGYLFLTGYKVRASKEMAANSEMIMNEVTDELFQPLEERLKDLRITIHATPLGDKANDRLASFLLTKVDPQRKGLKGFLQQYLEE